MGCISSKLLAKSGSFSEKVNQSFQRRSNVLEEILISNSKNNGDQQFVALLCSTNITQNLKSNSEINESESNAKPTEPNTDRTPSIETINTWELLAGLEEEGKEGKRRNQKENEQEKEEETEMGNDEKKIEDGVENGRSFRTVEDLNAIIALSEGEDGKNSTTEEDNTSTGTGTSTSSSSTGTKRKARAKELSELKLPAFEFEKSVSLRDWLSKGGPIFSPGSYITPKFGSVKKDGSVIGKTGNELGNEAVFDPEMLAQFEEAIEEMRREEESILKEIVDGLDLEEGNNNGEKKRLSMILEKDFIELMGQDIR
ncbi:hypothetical protein LUZ60_003304 [Juncus effusus]|nr:hypothetical protein LUZ60_003304 [Juncus effusus]